VTAAVVSLRGKLDESWQQAIGEWAVWLKAAGRPDTTIYLRTYQLRRLAQDVDHVHPWQMSVDVLAGWLGSWEWNAETRRSYRSAIRSFYRWATITGRIEKDPSTSLPTIAIPPGVPRPAPEMVIKLALASADARTRVMILLGACCGLRRSEIVTAHSDNLIGDSLRVTGKGRRVRVIPLPPTVLEALAGLPRGYYFPGRIDGHLAPATAGKLLSRALGPDWSGHALRHRFASVAYASERDLRAIQTLLGHSRPETTARYTAVPDGALRNAVAAASLEAASPASATTSSSPAQSRATTEGETR
jgi:integrase